MSLPIHTCLPGGHVWSGNNRIQVKQAGPSRPGVHLRPLPALRRRAAGLRPPQGVHRLQGRGRRTGRCWAACPEARGPHTPGGGSSDRAVRETPPGFQGGAGPELQDPCPHPASWCKDLTVNPQLSERRRQVPARASPAPGGGDAPEGGGPANMTFLRPPTPAQGPRLPPSTQTPPRHSAFRSSCLTESICSPADRLSRSSWKPQEGRGGQGKAPRWTHRSRAGAGAHTRPS